MAAGKGKNEHAEGASLPIGPENRLFRIDVDGPVAVAATTIVNAIHRGALSIRRLRETDADHAVAGDELGEFVLAQSLCAGGPLRKNEVSKLRVAVPNAHLHGLRKLNAELLQHATRVDNRARPVRRRLVPIWRQSKSGPRVAGAQGANDHI